jgi:hypothetical protein
MLRRRHLFIENVQPLVPDTLGRTAARARRLFEGGGLLFGLGSGDRGVLRQASLNLQLGLSPKAAQSLRRHLLDAEHHRLGTKTGADLGNRIRAIPSQETQNLHEAAGMVAAL